MNNNYLTYRLVQLKDSGSVRVDQLFELINSAYKKEEHGFWEAGWQRIGMTDLKSALEKESIIIAEIDGDIVGTIRVEKCATSAYFGMLATSPMFRGLGIGRQLVAEAEEWSKKNGCKIIAFDLLTPKNGKHFGKELLRKWYSSMGYKPLPFSPHGNHCKLNGLVIECNLTPWGKML